MKNTLHCHGIFKLAAICYFISWAVLHHFPKLEFHSVISYMTINGTFFSNIRRACGTPPPPLFLPIKIWIWIVVLLNWRCIFIVKSNVKCLHESTGAWGMDFVSSSPLLFSTTPLFSKFSYKSFLFQNFHNRSFFFIRQYQ